MFKSSFLDFFGVVFLGVAYELSFSFFGAVMKIFISFLFLLYFYFRVLFLLSLSSDIIVVYLITSIGICYFFCVS